MLSLEESLTTPILAAYWYASANCGCLGPQRSSLWHLERSLRFDEKRDSDEANNHQGGTNDEHVPDMISGGARSNSDLVVVSHDRSFVRVHGKLLSWAQHGPLLETRGRLVCSAHHDRRRVADGP